MTVLAVPALAQQTGWECGNTSLAAVAQFFGKRVTPAEVARLAGTTTSGTDHTNLIAAAEAGGATVVAKAGATIDDLAKAIAEGVPPIVGWWSKEDGDRDWRRRWNRRVRRKKDCGHYSVVKEVTTEHVVLMDPQEDAHGHGGHDRRFTRRGFERVWYDTDTHRYVRVSRWMMMARYHELHA